MTGVATPGALRLIIEHHPAWQRPAPDDTPTQATANIALSQTIYTLLGRRGAQWHTIVPRIENALDAVAAMDTANRSQLFDRLVIAHAKGVSGQPLGSWETFLCAIPNTTPNLLHKPSFADLLNRAEKRQHRAFNSDTDTTLTAVKHTKNDASFCLIVLFAVALWSQAAPVLIGSALLCVFETLYQLDLFDDLIPAHQHGFVRTARFYLYSLCAGLIAIPLLAGVMLRVFDALSP